MFAKIKVLDKDKRAYFMKVNPVHVSMINFENPKNIDSGTIITLRNGDEIYTPDTLDIVDLELSRVGERFAAIVVTQIAMEYTKIIMQPSAKKSSVKKPSANKDNIKKR